MGAALARQSTLYEVHPFIPHTAADGQAQAHFTAMPSTLHAK